MGRTKTDEKSHAKELYLRSEGKPDVAEIAKRAGVSLRTLRKWVKEEDWDKQRTSVLITRPKIIEGYYKQLELLNDHIADRPIVYDIPDALLKGTKLKDKKGVEYIEYPEYNPEDFPIKVGNFPTSSESHQITSITNAVKKLETEVSLAEIFEVSTAVLEMVKQSDFELYRTLLPVFDDYITLKSKK